MEALRILRVLWEAHGRGDAVRLVALHAAVRTGVERIEALLASMEAVSWARRVLPEGWMLSRDPATITLAQVYGRFVCRVDELAPACAGDAALEGLLHGVSSRVTGGMQISLEELFAPPQTAPVEAQARVQAV